MENKNGFTIGVVTPSELLFEQWKQTAGFLKYYNDSVCFIRISNTRHLLNREFYDIEKGFDFREVTKQVYQLALKRITKPQTL